MSGDVTALLLRWRDGDAGAIHDLTPLIYPELRRIAGHYLRAERKGHTLQATALVNEAFLHIMGRHNISVETRGDFLAIVSQLFRRVLVDHARKRLRNKRGGNAERVTLNEVLHTPEQRDGGLVRLDDALNTLAEMSPRQSKIVELKFFGGLSNEDIAEAIGASVATVKREWNVARAWLSREMASTPDRSAA